MKRPIASLARIASPVLGVIVIAGLAGCSDKPVTVAPVESAATERMDAIEREFRSLKDERDSLLHGASVSSSEALALASKLKEQQNRINELEARFAGLSSVAGTSPGTSSTGGQGGGSTGPGTSPMLPPVIGIPIPPDASQPFTEDQLGAFRRMSDEVDKRKTIEQAAKRLKDDLSRAGVSLNPEQEAAIAKLQSAYSEKIREIYRNGAGGSEVERQALVAQRDAIRAQYELDIRAAVPTADADKIVEAMSRGGGFTRRNGPGGMGGMGG